METFERQLIDVSSLHKDLAAAVGGTLNSSRNIRNTTSLSMSLARDENELEVTNEYSNLSLPIKVEPERIFTELSQNDNRPNEYRMFCQYLVNTSTNCESLQNLIGEVWQQLEQIYIPGSSFAV